MFINIENLGAIKKMTIDLTKKIIVFCGYNGTGKTYVSYILNAFLEFTSNLNYSCSKDILEQIEKKQEFVLERHFIEDWLGHQCSYVKEQVGNIFGISEETSSKFFDKFNISAELTDEDFNRAFSLPFEEHLYLKDIPLRISKKANDMLIKVDYDANFKDSELSRIWLNRQINILLRFIALGGDCGARMLTVERNSIYTFKTELSISRNELIDRIQQKASVSEFEIFDLLNNSSRRYPMAIRNSLRVANDLENVQKQSSDFEEIARIIESDLLAGEVSMTKNGDVEFHAKNMLKTRRLPFHLSSSIVKTMASLVIYLRHLAKRGDTLIIDEPEMNFHPKVQVLLTRLFAVMSSRGLRVVISTHSDYVVRELNNLIMLGSIVANGKAEMIKSNPYSEEMQLKASDMAVLHFEYASKNVVAVSNVPIEEYGFSVTSFDNTIEEINGMADNLYDILNYQVNPNDGV